MDWKGFTEWCKAKIVAHPNRKGEIIDIFEMAKAEIEDGGSVTHEIQLAMEDIAALEGR